MNIFYTILVYPIELIIGIIFTLANHVLRNPALAIVLVSLAVNVLVLPLYKKSDAMQEAERSKQAAMSHWVEHIKKTFTGDERFMMLSAYYRQQNYKPIYALRGSVSLLLQIPFFIAAYHFLSHSEALSGASFLMISDLAEPDGLLRIGGMKINVLPLLMTGINMVSGAIYTKGFTRKEKLQLYGTALVFLVLLYDSPSGLVFYWTLNNVFSLGKNIFTKLVPQPGKVIAILLSLGGFGVCPWLFVHYGTSKKRMALFIVLFLVLQVPLVLRFLKKKGAGKVLDQAEPDQKLFVLNTLLQTGLVGLLIASSVIGSEPVEFMRAGPLKLVGGNLCIFVGFFLVWLNVFYFLSDRSGKNAFGALVMGASLMFIANYLLFGKPYGIMSTLFGFEVYPRFSTAASLCSFALSVLLLGAGAFLTLRMPKLGKNICRVLLIGILAVSAMNCREIRQTVKRAERTGASEEGEIREDNMLRLSRDGKNVVVLMIDRAVSGYMPYLFAEDPGLEEAFEGFIYYPNMVSFGRFTNYGTPPLFGGYEYTPEEMNKRDTERISEKHDEALKMMPALFSENGFQVTVVDPPYAGYTIPSDLSIYDDLDNVRALAYYGNFNSAFEEDFGSAFDTLQRYNLFGYCVLRILPVPVRGAWYQEGDYRGFVSKSSFSCSDIFLKAYNCLPLLPLLTDIQEGDADTLLLMDNDAVHSPTYLDVSTYEPAAELDEADISPQKRKAPGLPDLFLETKLEIQTYEVSMASFRKVADWFRYLKEQDVYDNTRIIVVSDHGANAMVQFPDMVFAEGDILAEQFQALLMVKDFNSRESGCSDEFMTVADVPSLATEGLIANPVNPYTGKRISMEEKTAHPLMITGSRRWDTEFNNGKTFRTDDDYWYSVHDNIFLEENWEIVGRG